jgi:hypothetical protein
MLINAYNKLFLLFIAIRLSFRNLILKNIKKRLFIVLFKLFSDASGDSKYIPMEIKVEKINIYLYLLK